MTISHGFPQSVPWLYDFQTLSLPASRTGAYLTFDRWTDLGPTSKRPLPTEPTTRFQLAGLNDAAFAALGPVDKSSKDVVLCGLRAYWKPLSGRTALFGRRLNHPHTCYSEAEPNLLVHTLIYSCF